MTIRPIAITRSAVGGRVFSFSHVQCLDDGPWYIVESDCGVGRSKFATIRVINDMFNEAVLDYEFDLEKRG